MGREEKMRGGGKAEGSDFKAKCTKFDFGWGSAPDHAGGAYSAPPDPLAGFKGAASRQEGKGRDGEREGEGWGGRKRGGEEGRERVQILRLNAPNSISAGVRPQTTLEKLTALP